MPRKDRCSALDDDGYLRALADHLPDLLDELRPDIVLYDAGVDPHAADRLGRLEMTDRGLARRDAYVLHHCLRRGIPVAGVIGGGYSADHRALARRHTTIHRAAHDTFISRT